ncbi:MAG: hypothetical protein SO369_07475 [Treponema sp.]|nr:hypothetical protein [Treponema sp.]
MKIRSLVTTAIALSLLVSCNHGLLKDPRLYNPKKKSAVDTEITVAPEPDLGLAGGVDAFDLTDEWYNKADEGFPHTDFNTMSLVGTYFDNNNVPQYAMQSGDVWVTKDTAKGEFVHAKAPNTTGQGYEIKNVYWYQYRGLNPLYAADGTYNSVLQKTAQGNPKLSRFYFYRFTGDTLSPSLDNFLFAVDTYSKFMFAFAYPTKTESVFGNNVPKAWGPTDGDAFLGTTYQFYMYDPVGYVEKVDGKYNVVMYDWFKNNLAKGIYHPTLGGLDSKSSGTAFTETAQKEPSGAGKSPFNNHSVDFFSQNMEILVGKTFRRREKVGNEYGLVLYIYSFEKKEDKIIIKRTAESWKGFKNSTSLDSVEYTVGEGISATEGKLSTTDEKELTFSLTDESRTLTITASNGESDVAVSNFSDPTPSFRQRVQGAIYQKGKTKYVFSEDASSLTWTWDGGEKTYMWDGSPSDTEYTTYGGYRIRLYSNDFTIRGATVPNVGPLSVMEYEAVRFAEKGKTFSETVRGKPFSYREQNSVNGKSVYDVALMTLEFDGEGKTVSLYKEMWGKPKEKINTFNVSDNGTLESGTIDNASVKLTATEDNPNWTLEYEGNTYTYGYNDPGPAFVNRVKSDTTFVSEDKKTVYRFSNNGQRLHMSYSGGWLGIGAFDYTYEYQEEASTDSNQTSRAVYWASNGIKGFSYAGFELSNSDTVIKSTNTSAAGADIVDWLIMTYDAVKDESTGNLPTEEDFAAFYASLKGKTFKTRNVENEVAGLELLTFTFTDKQGGTLKKQVWLSSDESTEATIPDSGIQAISRTTGSYTAPEGAARYFFSYAPDVKSLEVTKIGSDGKTTSLTYYENYDDKGPGFINRVKGKTYQKYASGGQLETEYKFSADGKTLYLTYTGTMAWDSWGGKKATYTYNPDKEKGTSGKYTYAVYGNYYVDLTDSSDGKKDAVIRMETTTAASNYWATVMGYEATLVK